MIHITPEMGQAAPGVVGAIVAAIAWYGYHRAKATADELQQNRKEQLVYEDDDALPQFGPQMTLTSLQMAASEVSSMKVKPVVWTPYRTKETQ